MGYIDWENASVTVGPVVEWYDFGPLTGNWPQWFIDLDVDFERVLSGGIPNRNDPVEWTTADAKKHGIPWPFSPTASVRLCANTPITWY